MDAEQWVLHLLLDSKSSAASDFRIDIWETRFERDGTIDLRDVPPEDQIPVANIVIDHHGAGNDVRLPSFVQNELLARADDVSIPLALDGLPQVDQSTDAYNNAYKELARANAGGLKGAADRVIVADALLAITEPGATPTLMTLDQDVAKNLAKEFIDPPQNFDASSSVLSQLQTTGIPGNRALCSWGSGPVCS